MGDTSQRIEECLAQVANIGRGVGKGVNHIGIAEIDLVDLAESADTLHIAYKIASMQIIYPAVRINACGRGMSLDKYKVLDLDTEEFPDGYKSFTKQLKIKSSKCISYQVHRHCDEVWTFIDGEEELVFDGIRSEVGRGDTVPVKKGIQYASGLSPT